MPETQRATKIDLSAGFVRHPAKPSTVKEPNTGREILHAPIHAARIQATATEEHPVVKKLLEGAINGMDGVKLHGARDEKSDGRLKEKIKGEHQPPRTIPDFSAFRIAVDDRDAKDKAVKAIRSRFELTREKDEFEDGAPDTAFHAHILQARLPGSEVSHEVQVLPREQADAAEANHDLYEKARDGDEGSAAKLKDANRHAMEQFNSRSKATHPERKGGRGESPEPAAGADTKSAPATEKKTKYDFGNTQAPIAHESDAGRALKSARAKIDPKDLNPTEFGGDPKGLEEDPHVTVRYGIQGDDTAGIEKYLRSQTPFQAKLKKISSFPPNEHTEGAAVLKADVDSPELHRMNREIQQHGDFKESDFPEYKPHATVAYVKPEAAAKYVGAHDTEGKSFPVRSVMISDRDGKLREIPFEGKAADVPVKGQAPRPPKEGPLPQNKPVEKKAEVRAPRPPSGLHGRRGDESKKPDAENVFQSGRQSTPIQVRDSDGNWVSGTLDYYNGGVNGTPRRGRVTLSNGFKMNNVGDADMKLQDEVKSEEEDWIGVDIDGTLAHYDGFKGKGVIGKPVPEMADRVKGWLKDGKDVRLFTARIGDDPDGTARKAIEAWSVEHLGKKLPITQVKDDRMKHLYDDRAVQVERNTGKLVTGEDTRHKVTKLVHAGDPEDKSDVATGTAALDALPEPMKQALDTIPVKVTSGGSYSGSGDPAIASVGDRDPSTIEVNDASQFAKDPKQVVAHEATHIWQNNLPPSIQAKIPADPESEHAQYDISNIHVDRLKGKTMLDLPREQQATIVQTYSADPSQRKKLQPWIDDIAKVPLSSTMPTDPNAKGLNMAPRPPAGSDAAGIMASYEAEAKKKKK